MPRVVYIIRHGHGSAAEAADEAGLGLYGEEQRQAGRGGQQEQRPAQRGARAERRDGQQRDHEAKPGREQVRVPHRAQEFARIPRPRVVEAQPLGIEPEDVHAAQLQEGNGAAERRREGREVDITLPHLAPAGDAEGDGAVEQQSDSPVAPVGAEQAVADAPGAERGEADGGHEGEGPEGESAGPRGPPAVFYGADAQRREPDERERGEEAEFCPRDVRVALEPRPERQGEEHEADELVREPARRIFHAAILAHLAPCAQRRLALLSSRGCSDVF